MRQLKALVLLSGGLDSILAAKILVNLGIKVKALAFRSYFFGTKKAEKAAKKLGLEIKIVDFSREHFEIVKTPKYGYGKNLNPCIDCHLLMLRKAKEIMEKERFDFVATGEVLGERPMSQNKQALELIEKEAGLFGRLLRPLSAKLLKPTEVERKGLVDREKLLDIQGRSRKKQMELAEKWGIEDYPTPAGGCLLTDPGFSERLRELVSRCSEVKENDLKLLRVGRHFWLGYVKIIVGRNHKENLEIKKLRQKDDVLIEIESFTGPTTLIRACQGEIPKKAIKKAQELTQYYSLKTRGKKQVEFKLF